MSDSYRALAVPCKWRAKWRPLRADEDPCLSTKGLSKVCLLDLPYMVIILVHFACSSYQIGNRRSLDAESLVHALHV